MQCQLVLQSSFLPAKQVKEFFKLVEYLWASLVIFLLSALYGIEIYLILVYLIQIALPLHLYEYKDKHLVKQVYMIFFLYQLNLQQFQPILGGNK